MRTVSRTFIGVLLVATAAAVSVDLVAQSAGAAKSRAASPAGSKHRTPWGDPDLQGIWSNTTTTPLERPDTLKDKAVLSDEEQRKLEADLAAARDRLTNPAGKPAARTRNP